MLYVLIIIMMTSHGAGVTTAEFNGEANCWNAATQINKMSRELSAFCAKRGN